MSSAASTTFGIPLKTLSGGVDRPCSIPIAQAVNNLAAQGQIVDGGLFIFSCDAAVAAGAAQRMTARLCFDAHLSSSSQMEDASYFRPAFRKSAQNRSEVA
jgi:hypothetical protein